MSVEHNNEYNMFKCLFIGPPAVGKTSLVRRLVKKRFDMDYKPTIGVDFSQYRTTFQDKTVVLQLWDLTGQDYFSGLSRVYYKGAACCFVVADITSPSTVTDTQTWLATVGQTTDELKNMPLVILANKADLVSDEEADAKLKELQQTFKHQVILTSARTGMGIVEAVDRIIPMLIEQTKRPQPVLQQPVEKLIIQEPQKKSGCC